MVKERRELFEEVLLALLKRNYVVKKLNSPFDIVAVKDKNILLLKLVSCANSINNTQIRRLLALAFFINAHTFLLSNWKDESTKLAEDTLYSRFGMPLITPETFEHFLDGYSLFLTSSNAGSVAIIDGLKLREAMTHRNISPSSLSRLLGVSKSMILKYERGFARVTEGRAFKLYNIFGSEIFKSVEIIIKKPSLNQDPSPLTKKYTSLGFEAFDTKGLPFNIVAKKDDEIILTAFNSDGNNLKSISKLLEVFPLSIFSGKKKLKIKVPSMSYEDFLMLEDASELLSIVDSYHL